MVVGININKNNEMATKHLFMTVPLAVANSLIDGSNLNSQMNSPESHHPFDRPECCDGTDGIGTCRLPVTARLQIA